MAGPVVTNSDGRLHGHPLSYAVFAGACTEVAQPELLLGEVAYVFGSWWVQNTSTLRTDLHSLLGVEFATIEEALNAMASFLGAGECA